MVEKPKMLKSSSIVYAFDFADTLFRKSNGRMFKFLKYYFGLHQCLNPDEFDIRWIITCKGSWFYKLFIFLKCWLNGLVPSQVIMTKNISKTLIDIADQKNIIKYVDPKKISKIYYITNNISLVGEINSSINRLTHNIVAMSAVDFLQQKFDSLV